MQYRATAHVHHNGRTYRPEDVLEIDDRSEIERADMAVLVALGRVTLVAENLDPASTTKKRGAAQ
ncbi:MAG: hypothetical protein HQL07_04510 [Nitrospirae bacterium]|nr:hypothetical protein [Magnetococcales bacterium]HAT50750.1 hypothetical protein [Alphaproteobacteria bacterium]